MRDETRKGGFVEARRGRGLTPLRGGRLLNLFFAFSFSLAKELNALRLDDAP